MRRVSLGLVGLLVLGLLAAFVTVVPPTVRGTDVPGGYLPADATWDAAGSPYVIRGNVTVASGFTLTIGPGVEVLFAGNYSLTAVDGYVFANGTASQPVTFAPSVDNGGVSQWGVLDASGLHDCRVVGASQVRIGFWGRGEAANRCSLDRVYGGLMAYASHQESFGNLTIRRSSTALTIVATVDSTFANVTIDDAQVAVTMQHGGGPMVGSDSERTVLAHVTASNFGTGVRVVHGDLPPPKTNRIVHSLFRNGTTVFPTNFTGYVYGNDFVNTTQDFGFPAADGLGYYDDGARGNYWSNYTGTDGNGDGIGDTPYGPDRYPLMAPVSDAGGPAAPVPKVLSIAPAGTGVSVTASVTITFNARMDAASVQAAVSVSPAFAYGTEWSASGDVLTLVPSGVLAPDTEYTVTVAASATDANGTALGHAYTGTFRTAPESLAPWFIGGAVAIMAVLFVAAAYGYVRWRRGQGRKGPVT